MTDLRHILPERMLSSLSELLAQRTGLNFPEERWSDLERGISAAAHASGEANVAAYVHQLLSAPLTHHQTKILATHLTVGETYFFRDGKSFELLEQYALPALIRSRRDRGRRLRIWSAGCCTGEEPYSIAMLLDRLLSGHERWDITLLATDINPQFLRKGADGVYGDWSFRDTPAWIKERYFKEVRQGYFEIHPRIKKMVMFSYLNLADDVYPSLSNNIHAMDLILCRNVLMYFAAAQAAKIAGNLHRALVDDGGLLVSPAEASNTLLAQFAPAHFFSGAAIYRKAAPATPPSAGAEYSGPAFTAASPATWETIPAAEEIPPFFPPPGTQQPDVLAPTIKPPTAPPDGADALCVTARLCADQGRLAEAAGWCEQAIATDRLNPQSHYLLATIRQELGQADAAEQSLKRALYLAPDFVLAHFTLGNLRLSQGRREEAGRYFGNALTLLQRRPCHETVMESDGLTAGRLENIIRSVLDTPDASRRNASPERSSI
ncbi:CheR family methyltransferase [Rhodoferax sp.]|uniref:CheR family methyltransferase n=1 Tax=Rhodoferax sp. TaxID=50421 RepID=UPI00275ED3EA|nr:CheR family methyltransferase [Rhodoferax sp.]